MTRLDEAYRNPLPSPIPTSMCVCHLYSMTLSLMQVGKEKYDFIPIRADAHFSIFTISSYFFFFLFPLFTILIPSWLHMFVMVSSRDNDDDVSTTMAMTEKRVNSLYANSHSHTSRKGKFFTYPSSIYSHCGYCEEWSIFPGVLRYE